MENNSIINPELYYMISGKNEIKLDKEIKNYKMLELENLVGNIINGDCREVMSKMPMDSVDLIVTSPPYGVGIDYDVHDDDMLIAEYLKFTKEWLTEAYKVLKDDGRIAVNIPYEINRQDKGGRVFIVSEIWQIMKEIGLQKGSSAPGKDSVGKITKAQIENVAKKKMVDMNSSTLEACMQMVKGSATSMGLEVVE